MARNPKQDANLKRGNPATQFKSGRDAAENGRKGGIASGEAKRAKRSMASLAKTIAESPATPKNDAQLAKMGIEEDDRTMNAVVVASVYKAAIAGDDKAVERWLKWTEEVTPEDKPYELPARSIGKAFCDINRQIEPNRTYVFKGGRGGLKSSYISLKILELVKNNPNMHACCVRKVGATLKDSVYAQIKWAINELGLTEEFQVKSSPLEIIYKKTGQIIFFRGCDDPLKLKSIKPPFGYIGILWKEEKDQLAGPEEERSINQSVLRGGDISYDFSSYNPPKSRSNWVNKILLEPNANRIVHHSSYLDAPPEWLGQKFLDDAEHLREVNPSAYDHEYGGEPNGDGGNVFDNIVSRTITDDDIKKFDKIYQGVDWGWYPDPFAFVRLHYDRARETIYFIDEIIANKKGNEIMANEIKQKGYGDYRITCDSAEPKSVGDFRACGLPAKEAIKGPGSVDYGLKWMQARTLVIDQKRTPYAYKEFMQYEFERDKDDNVISGYPDKNNHTIDAVRYAFESVWRKYGSNA